MYGFRNCVIALCAVGLVTTVVFIQTSYIALPVQIIATSETVASAKEDQAASETIIDSSWGPPLSRAKERVTKKPFGIFIDPKTSLIQPEHFRGYHTGTDFEIFPEELKTNVTIHAVCDGKILVKRRASGYGGVVVQSCAYEKNPVTVVYGHLALSGVLVKVGDSISQGGVIGSLGANKSYDTDGERKHLHLGVHKGSAVNILGHVSKKRDLLEWLDPCVFVCTESQK